MTYEQKDNSGSLFKNARKEKETHPDYNGSVRINGVDMWISSWLKKDKNGNTYMSLSFKPKEGNPVRGLADDLRANSPQAPAPMSQRAKPGMIEDDVPFAPEWR